MHELAVTESLLKIAVSEAESHKAQRILSIKIKLGEYSDIVPELIQEFFDVIAKNSIAEGARLVVERIPVTVECLSCAAVSRLERMSFSCPQCKSTHIKMLTGREFFIDSLEAE